MPFFVLNGMLTGRGEEGGNLPLYKKMILEGLCPVIVAAGSRSLLSSADRKVLKGVDRLGEVW